MKYVGLVVSFLLIAASFEARRYGVELKDTMTLATLSGILFGFFLHIVYADIAEKEKCGSLQTKKQILFAKLSFSIMFGAGFFLAGIFLTFLGHTIKPPVSADHWLSLSVVGLGLWILAKYRYWPRLKMLVNYSKNLCIH